jgi:formylglycine-generating enzyme required for sulfatase activity
MVEIEVPSFEVFEEMVEDSLSKIEKLRQYNSFKGFYPPLFRGQRKSSWELESTLMRYTKLSEYPFLVYYLIMKDAQKKIHKDTGEKWNINYPPFGERGQEIPNDEIYRFMIYLRHHGFPSPLLDWTSSKEVATFFAFRNHSDEKDEKYVAVYEYLDRIGRSGEKFGWTGKPHVQLLGPDVTKPDIRHEKQKSWYILSIKTIKERERICNIEDAIKNEQYSDEKLRKYLIPSSERKKVLKKLEKLGINSINLFPDEEPSRDVDLLMERLKEGYFPEPLEDSNQLNNNQRHYKMFIKDTHVERRDYSHNPFEDNVEYIKIPGGTYKYSVSKKMVTVPDLYFCKYPVTNKRYRRFISFLAGKESELLQKLPLELYAEKLLIFAEDINGFKEYLGKQPEEWHKKFRSYYDDNKEFNGDDHPVVAVTWYAARAYCCWLSCLDSAIKGNNRIEDIKMLPGAYRLPSEVEWEWAAGGNPDGSMRTYPWPEDIGEPNPLLANYNRNVRTTTEVGYYTYGATPHGLMDMAGNVGEWMDNPSSVDSVERAIRGLSLYHSEKYLRCSSRWPAGVFNLPYNCNKDVGFRVVFSLLPQS